MPNGLLRYANRTQTCHRLQKTFRKLSRKRRKASSKALSKDLNKASNQVGKAARQLTNIKEARDLHRQNWLKHLKDSVVSWQKQLQVFKDQQQEYGEQMLKAQQDLTSSRRHLQNLNKQAAATGTPVSTVSGETQPEPTDLENQCGFRNGSSGSGPTGPGESSAKHCCCCNPQRDHGDPVRRRWRSALKATTLHGTIWRTRCRAWRWCSQLLAQIMIFGSDLTCPRNASRVPIFNSEVTESAEAYCDLSGFDAACTPDLTAQDTQLMIRCHSIHWDPSFVSEPTALGRANTPQERSPF